MPVHEFVCQTVVSTLENGTLLGRVLLYPEVTAYEDRAAALRRKLDQLALDALNNLPVRELHRRQAAGPPEVRETVVEVQPPAWGPTWQVPVKLRFHAICWTHGEAAAVAYVPALDIEVVARRPEDLPQRLDEEIRFALMRTRANTSLRHLVWLQRRQAVVVEPIAVTVDVRTPKELALQRQESPQESVLEEVATNLTRATGNEVFEMDADVQRVADWLWGSTPRSVLLVGPSGVGKTAVVHRLARQRNALFWSTSGARLVAGMTGFGMWQERCQQLCKEAARTKAVLHLGNLAELMQVGRSVHNDQGVGDFLRPYIARGEWLAIVECTPEQLALIERTASNLLEAFARVEIAEPSPQAARRILAAAAQAWGGRDALTPAAIETLDLLHRRYASYSAYPGRPLRFLRNVLEDARAREDATAAGSTAGPPGKMPLAPADVTAAFSRETGLPLVLLEESARLDLADARQWFRQRVIGQERAVDVIIDLLATVKARLSRPDRPIASLLFIGPTGVGKTEMAKALAEFLYRDRRRMTRIDMSEFADPLAPDRLIGGSTGEGILTSKVREQPFGVVLLDEFEKADPRLFDLLLQVLGEGRLTDAAGRLAEFRNSVIIMTSNLGAESFGRQTLGFADAPDPGQQAQEHFVREVQRFVRPELYNRIDRIVTFLPLDRPTLRQIAGRELTLLQQRDGIRFRDLQVSFGDSLVEEIVRLGYDPRYGARPIKRAVERHLLAPLAAALNRYSAEVPLRAEVSVAPEGIAMQVRGLRPVEGATDADGEGPDDAMVPSRIIGAMRDGYRDLASVAVECTRLRRQVSQLQQSGAMTDVLNELYRLEKHEHLRTSRHSTMSYEEERVFSARLTALRGISERMRQLWTGVVGLEESALMACYGGKPLDGTVTSRELSGWQEDLETLELDLYARHFEQPDFITLAVFGEDSEWLAALAGAYHRLAVQRQYKVQVYRLIATGATTPVVGERILLGDKDSPDPRLREQANETSLQAERIVNPATYLAAAHAEDRGIALCLEAPLAWPRLSPEAGLHVRKELGGKNTRCVVHASTASLTDYQPPAKIDRREGIGPQELRRTYDAGRQLVEDRLLRNRKRWNGELASVIGARVDEWLLSQVKQWIGA